MHVHSVLANIAAAHHSLVPVRVAYEKGLTRGQLRHQISTGHLVQVHRGVLAVAGAPLTFRSQVLAAIEWAGREDSAASHRSAGALHELYGLRELAVEISSRKDMEPCGAFTIHRPRRLPDWQITEVDGIPTTIPSRTLLDLCAVAKPWDVRKVRDSALREGKVTLDELEHMLRVESKSGRTGMRLFREICEEVDPEKGIPGSVLASMFLDFLRREGFPPPVAEFRVDGPDGFVKILDFAYPSEKLGFEVDGRRDHDNSELYWRDREGDAMLIALGWRIMRITHTQLLRPARLRFSVGGALGRHV